MVAILMSIVSLAGIFFQSAIYPTTKLRQSFVPNDVVNLFIGLPILLGSIWLTRNGKLLGLLFLPGALFYVVYNYVAYVIAMPINLMPLAYLVLVVLSAYAMIQVLASIDAKAVQQRLVSAVPIERPSPLRFAWAAERCAAESRWFSPRPPSAAKERMEINSGAEHCWYLASCFSFKLSVFCSIRYPISLLHQNSRWQSPT